MNQGVPGEVASVDVAIVGAGAAGLMAAIAAARSSPPVRVLLIDGRARIGAKILMSGGTRCNVTHRRVSPSDYNGGPSHVVRHVLAAFTPGETIDFFKEIGVELTIEPTGKLFPSTHAAKTVLDALIREAVRRSVAPLYGVKVTEVEREGEGFILRGRNAEGAAREVRARRVVLATGGLSHPDTGSDGTGIEIARKLGHEIVPTSPALTPLMSRDKDWQGLAGVSLDAKLALYAKGRKAKEISGPFLFTHLGFSGPAALDLSRHWVRTPASDSPEVRASFLVHESEAGLKARIESAAAATPAKSVKGFVEKEFGLPERLTAVLVTKAGITPGAVIGHLSGERRRVLAKRLLDCPLEVSGVVGYGKAEATAGGVALSEVRVSTMESRRVPGLYLAGEILDVDGRIGGFNFQWSWSTGAIAGRSAAAGLNVP